MAFPTCASSLGVHLVVLILRDDAYGMIRWKQEAMGLPDFGLNFKNPDFVAYAAAYGAHGVRVQRTAELLPVLEQCLRAPGVHVLEVPIDYSENRLFTRELAGTES
jgi:acetolactate synthase-1/2/3 large subunit